MESSDEGSNDARMQENYEPMETSSPVSPRSPASVGSESDQEADDQMRSSDVASDAASNHSAPQSPSGSEVEHHSPPQSPSGSEVEHHSAPQSPSGSENEQHSAHNSDAEEDFHHSDQEDNRHHSEAEDDEVQSGGEDEAHTSREDRDSDKEESDREQFDNDAQSGDEAERREEKEESDAEHSPVEQDRDVESDAEDDRLSIVSGKGSMQDDDDEVHHSPAADSDNEVHHSPVAESDEDDNEVHHSPVAGSEDEEDNEIHHSSAAESDDNEVHHSSADESEDDDNVKSNAEEKSSPSSPISDAEKAQESDEEKDESKSDLEDHEKSQDKSDSESDAESQKEEADELIADIFGESDEDEEFEGFKDEDLGPSKKKKETKKKKRAIVSDDESGSDVEQTTEAKAEEEEEVDENQEKDESGLPDTETKEDEQKTAEVLPAISDDDDEFDDDKKKRSKDMVYDFDVMLQSKKDSMPKRKRKDVDIINDSDDLIVEILQKMRHAAEEDRMLNKNRQAATKKLKLLTMVVSQIQKADLKVAFLDQGVLYVMSDWLSPLPDKSLPHLHIREAMLKLLSEFPSIDQSLLKSSGVGRAVMYLYKHPKETKDNKDRAGKLISEWARPIFNLNTNFHSMSKEERETRDFEHMPKNKKMRMEGGDEPPQKDIDKVLSGEEKSLRPGDKGWIGRARVPLPSTKDYVFRPKWNVEMEFGRGSGKKPLNRYERHLRNFGEKKKMNKQQRAITISIEGRKMSL